MWRFGLIDLSPLCDLFKVRQKICLPRGKLWEKRKDVRGKPNQWKIWEKQFDIILTLCYNVRKQKTIHFSSKYQKIYNIHTGILVHFHLVSCTVPYMYKYILAYTSKKYDLNFKIKDFHVFWSPSTSNTIF